MSLRLAYTVNHEKLIKKKSTSLPSAFAVPDSTQKLNFVTPETSLTYPRPLRQVDSKQPFLLPSSTMAEADGTHTAPLDLSEREWPLLSYVADPPPKVIPPTAGHKPPDIMSTGRLRKRSSRRSRRKHNMKNSPPRTIVSPSKTVTSESPPSPSRLQHDNVEPSYMVSPPSPSTATYLNDKQGIIVMPPSSSPTISYHDVEPNNLPPFPSPLQATSHDSDLNNLNLPTVFNSYTDTPLSSPQYNRDPLPAFTSNFDDVENFCWVTIAAATDCSMLPWDFKPINENLRSFLWNICDWEIADCCLLHQYSISSIRQIASLPPSTFETWDIGISLKQDLRFINWWPRFYRKRSEEILYLSPDEHDTAYSQMTSISDLAHMRRLATQHSRGRPHRQYHRATTNSHSYSTPIPSSTIVHPPITTISHIITAEPASQTTTDDVRLFDDCIIIDAVNVYPPDDTVFHSSASSSSSITHYHYDDATNHNLLSHDASSSHHDDDLYPRHTDSHSFYPDDATTNDNISYYDDDGDSYGDGYSSPDQDDY